MPELLLTPETRAGNASPFKEIDCQDSLKTFTRVGRTILRKADPNIILRSAYIGLPVYEMLKYLLVSLRGPLYIEVMNGNLWGVDMLLGAGFNNATSCQPWTPPLDGNPRKIANSLPYIGVRNRVVDIFDKSTWRSETENGDVGVIIESRNDFVLRVIQ